MVTTQDCIMHKLEVLDAKYPNTIPIFGGALWVYHENDLDLECFLSGIPHVVHSAKFFNWHGGVVDAVRTYCHICMVDPMLVEVALGVRLEDAYAV